jgi:hypothetical protein
MIPWNGHVMVWWTIQESSVEPILRKKEKLHLFFIFLVLFAIFLSLFATLLNSTSRVLSTGCVFNLKYTQPN